MIGASECCTLQRDLSIAFYNPLYRKYTIHSIPTNPAYHALRQQPMLLPPFLHIYVQVMNPQNR